MALSTTVANVISDDDSRIITTTPTKYLFRETRSSRELYEDYKSAYPAKLDLWGINDDNYIREPNGTGQYAGLWVPNYPRDIWDFWINYRFENNGERFYYSQTHPDYISVINKQEDAIEFVSSNEPGTPVYSPQLIYLWDFIYNPEVITSRTLSSSTRQVRRRPFPVYTEEGKPSDDSPIVPPYLPDATFPVSYSTIYPWAAWEISISLAKAQIQDDVLVPLIAIRAQEQKFVRAHGESRLVTETDTDAYRFTPHESKKGLGRVVRPLYPIQEATLYKGFHAVPYSPLVLRNVSPFNSNGWIYCYRQAVRYSSDIYLPKNRLWKELKRAVQLLYETPGMSIDYAVFTVLPRQFKVLWPTERLEFLENNITLVIPQERSLTQEANDVKLLREIINQVRNLQDIYELATTISGPVMEPNPYMIITLQVYEQRPWIRRVVSFGTTGQWTLTVPPLLSVTKPLTLETTKTDAALSWHSSVHHQKMKIMFDGDDIASSHQIRAVSSERGEMLVRCRIEYALRRTSNIFTTTYEFVLGWFEFITKTFAFDHALRNTLLSLSRELNLNFDDYYRRQISEETIYAYSSNPEYLQNYIQLSWPKYDIGDGDDVIRRDMFSAAVDFAHPVILARDVKTKGQYYVFVIKLQPVVLTVHSFGQQVQLVASYDDVNNYLVWKNPQGVVLRNVDSDEVVITVVSPRQLGLYLGEVYVLGTAGLPGYVISFIIRLKVNTDVPLDFLQRTSIMGFEKTQSWAYNNRAVRYEHIPLENRDLQYVYDLRTDYNGEFFRKMIVAWAYNHLVDLENYAQCFPLVIEYCRYMDNFVAALNHSTDRKVQIVERLHPDLRQFLPVHLAEPLLNIILHEYDVDPVDSRYAYIVFDPLHARWINILALEPHSHPITNEWLPQNQSECTSLITRIQQLFNLTSIELHTTNNQSLLVKPSGWRFIRQEYDESRNELETIRRDARFIATEIHTEITDFNHYAESKVENFIDKFRDEIFSNTANLELERFTVDIRRIREYSRFFNSILWPCFKIKGDTISSTAKPAWVVYHPAINQMWTWWESNTDEFRILWSAAIKFHTNPMTYSVFGPVAIRAKENPDNELEYLFINFKQDGLIYSSRYVLAKFLNFVCTNIDTVAAPIENIEVIRTIKDLWLNRTETIIQQEIQQKNPL